MAGTYAVGNRLFEHELGEESTNEGVSGTICIDQELPVQQLEKKKFERLFA